MTWWSFWGGRVKVTTLIAFILSLIVQVGLTLAVTLVFRRRTRAPWQPFVYGAMIFAGFQLFTWLPLSVYIDVAVGGSLSDTWAFLWLWALALATSLAEEFGRWVGFRYLFRRSNLPLTWRNGVMYGLGHGGLETLLLIAGLTFINMLAYIVLTGLDLTQASESATVSPAFVQELEAIAQTTWLQPLIVAFERVLALPHQVAWSLLVMQSLASRQKRWFGFAVLHHTAVALVVPGLVRLSGYGLAEAVNLGFAALSVWIILKLRSVAIE
jgi:uncharacterized membrane protein YhfC